MIKAKNFGDENPDFGDLLAHIYQQKKIKNSRFSLRGFARFLGIEPAFLSKLLRGNRNFTPQNIERIGAKIGLSRTKIEFYKNQIIEKVASRANRAEKNTLKIRFRKRSSEEFKFIASWYYLAALELMSLPGFEPNAHFLCKKLDLTVTQAEECLKRLTTLGYLQPTPTGFMITKINNSFEPLTHTTEEMRALQKQFLQKSALAVDVVPLPLRDHSGITLTIASAQIPEAKELIRKFRRKFTALMQKNMDHDSVYQLTVSLFPLTTTPLDSGSSN